MSDYVKLEGIKKKHKMEDSDVITCETHNVEITYGSLDPIQQLAFLEGLDTTPDMPCLLIERNKGGHGD